MQFLFAFLAGGSQTLAFAPFNWWPFSILSCMVLFFLWLRTSSIQAALLGLLFGLGLFGSGVSWTYISLNQFGGMPPALAAISILGLVLFLSLYPTLCGWLQSLFTDRPQILRLGIIMPCLWLFTEWLRGWLFSGFPWLSIGYSMLDTPIEGFAPLGGVYALGLAVLISAGILLNVLTRPTRVSALYLLPIIALLLGGIMLQHAAWTKAVGKPIKVAMIQHNVPLTLKWDAAENSRIINAYLATSDSHSNHDLIVWPEAAVPDFLDRLSSTFWARLERNPADFIIGALEREQYEQKWQTYNSIVAYNSKTDTDSLTYRKQHLVPFGEYVPMQFILAPILYYLSIPMSDFTPWRHPQQPLEIAGTKAAMSICFEDAFPTEIRNQIPAAEMLVNVSEDAWFGNSLAPHQRLQMARLRSLESGRPMIRASNSGLSSLIDVYGQVYALAPQFISTVVSGMVQPHTGTTPYVKYGNLPTLMLALGLFLLAIVNSDFRRKYSWWNNR